MYCKEIDWEEQWRLFAPNFKEGKAHIDLFNFGILPLLPGPGFGDLSHPTTRLMLKLMASRVKGKEFVDIGCGSGILTLAALKMGASFSYAIDLEKEALIHTRKNARLNGLEKSILLSKKIPINQLKTPLIVGMNMIFSEQKIAWNSRISSAEIITSGILKKERNEYLKWTQKNNWKIVEELNEGEWSAFYYFY